MRKILTILMLLSVLLLAVACTQTATPTEVAPKVTETTTAPVVVATGTVHQVVLENFQFMPTDLQVKAGDAVEFVNKDNAEHTVTFESGDFDQKLPVGGKATYTATEKGTFTYFCSVHPGMRGTVTVN